MIKLHSLNRTTVPVELYRSLIPFNGNHLKVYFNERAKSIIFSEKQKKGSVFQVGEVYLDSKHRILFQEYLLELISKLLQGDFSDLYFCINQNRELCIKRVPK